MYSYAIGSLNAALQMYFHSQKAIVTRDIVTGGRLMTSRNVIVVAA